MLSSEEASRTADRSVSSSSFWETYIREGQWFTQDKAVFSSALIALLLIAGLWYLLVAPLDISSPNGTLALDYISFWLAGKQVLTGTPELVYNLDAFTELQKQHSGLDVVFAFFYPPMFQLLQVPFGILPFKVAYIAFIVITLVFLCWSLRLITKSWLIAACLFMMPACIYNAFNGQNAALATAFFALFFACLERRSYFLAGVAIGLATFKPQLGALVPFALIACGNWRTFFSAALTTLVFAGLSVAVLGPEVWIAFWEQIPVASQVMQEGAVDWEKMISLYASLRLLGLEHTFAFTLQIIVGLLALMCVWSVWRKTDKMHIRSTVLIAGNLLVTPFALSYDMTLLCIPCAYLIKNGLQNEFLPYERTALACVIGLSASTAPIAVGFGVPFAPLLPFTILLFGVYHLSESTTQRLERASKCI